MPTTIQMDHAKGLALASLRRKWFVLLLRVGIIEVIMYARVASADKTGVPPTGSLCISECTTCPVICSPPPPPLKSKPPPSPPPVHHSPPESYHHHSPPPTPPPPSYILWGSTPPPPSDYINIPYGQAPPGVGQHNPYYYLYSSKASSLSLHASFFLMLVLSVHVMFFCW